MCSFLPVIFLYRFFNMKSLSSLAQYRKKLLLVNTGKESVPYTGVKLFYFAVFTRGAFAGTFYTRLGTSDAEGNSPLLPQGKKQIL